MANAFTCPHVIVSRSIKRGNRWHRCVSYLDCVPVSVLVLPLFVAPVMAARGGRGGSLLRLQVLQRRVHVLRVLLAWLVLLILEIWWGVAFRSAACFAWQPETKSTSSASERTNDCKGKGSWTLLNSRIDRESTYVFHSCDRGYHQVHILPANSIRVFSHRFSSYL